MALPVVVSLLRFVTVHLESEFRVSLVVDDLVFACCIDKRVPALHVSMAV